GALVGVLLARVVDRHDRGVVERGRVLGLATEALVEGLIARQLGAHDLDGHVAAQGGVARTVDLRHTAEAQRLADLVSARQQLRCGHPPFPPLPSLPGPLPLLPAPPGALPPPPSSPGAGRTLLNSEVRESSMSCRSVVGPGSG